MSDTLFPRYPGGNDPDPSQSDRHEDAARTDPWHHAAVVLLFAVVCTAVLLYHLTILLIRMMPMPVLI